MNILLNIRFILGVITLCAGLELIAQDRAKAQQTISELCTDDMAGRGYLEDGDRKAAEYIAEKFAMLGLKAQSDNYLQPFLLNVNTITKCVISQDNKTLVPGKDYLVAPTSCSTSISGAPFYISERLLVSGNVAKKVKRAVKRGFVPVICVYDPKNEEATKNIDRIKKCVGNGTLVYLKSKLTWSVGRERSKSGEVWLLSSSFSRMAKNLSIEIESELIKDYQTQNVYGYVPGTDFPDSIVIFCGHYDHLGKMGDAIFYGANDNASGISMLIDMAGYFVNNPQKYSVAFIAFGGEEAGLVGSLHYVQNPMVPLSKTKFVFNMDLMGSGEKGATIVNGSVYTNFFDKLTDINTRKEYLPIIKSRGKAANSDHYFFSELGVPSFFMYLMGDYTHYHVPTDNAENLELGVFYDRSFLLIRDFIIALNQ